VLFYTRQAKAPLAKSQFPTPEECNVYSNEPHLHRAPKECHVSYRKKMSGMLSRTNENEPLMRESWHSSGARSG
jgi:hypothetical protein